MVLPDLDTGSCGICDLKAPGRESTGCLYLHLGFLLDLMGIRRRQPLHLVSNSLIDIFLTRLKRLLDA